ncbi:MAG: hypothetical protein K2V38_27935 [Gemmataceae bacterium]|nr:hypothetical protein [Gemmataceae bacterium]
MKAIRKHADEFRRRQDKMPLPKTLDEAVVHLLSVLSDESKARVRGTLERDLILFHHGWGTGIRNDLGLWGRNPELLASCGSPHPDDASMVIIRAVWRALQNA